MDIGALAKSGQKSLRERSLQGLEVPLPHKPRHYPPPDIPLQSRTCPHGNHCPKEVKPLEREAFLCETSERPSLAPSPLVPCPLTY